MMARMTQWTKMDDELKGIDLGSKKIRLDYLLQYGGRNRALSRITAEFVGLGIHPFDEVGRAKFDDKPWWDAFLRSGGVSQFSPQLPADRQLDLERRIMTNQYELVEDVIFANTFLRRGDRSSLPVAFPRVERRDRKLDAWLRVFASASEEKGRYFDRNNYMTWDRPQAVPKTTAFGGSPTRCSARVSTTVCRAFSMLSTRRPFRRRCRGRQATASPRRATLSGDESPARGNHLHRGEQICRCYMLRQTIRRARSTRCGARTSSDGASSGA
jgi:hypothetical protein